MASIDNLNFYSNGLPAGQLTDKYSTQPGCLRSKNLDIFSSSKSTKATAWSTPTTTDADVIKQDGKLVLKTDGKVYERVGGVDTLLKDPSVGFPVYQVSYNGKYGTYTDATWGTVQDLVAKYEGDELKSYVVFTDRASYTWSSVKFTPKKYFSEYSSNLTLTEGGQFQQGYRFDKNTNTGASSYIMIKIENPQMATAPVKVYADQSNDSETDITLDRVYIRTCNYYYNPQIDGMAASFGDFPELPLPATDIKTAQVTIDVPTQPGQEDQYYWLQLQFKYTRHSGVSTYGWSGALYVDFNDGTSGGIMYGGDGDYNEYYSYLPTRERKLVSVGDYGYSESFWMKGTSFQPLYKWTGSWITVDNDTREIKSRYDFVADMGWETDVSMDIIGMMIWNEQVYMIGNMNGNGYIIPCDLSGGRGTPYIAYGCTFTGVANIDYLMYLVGEDRGISQLRAYNGQELVKVIGGNKESNTNDLIDIEEQYKFDGKIVKYRGNLILSTSDNRIFEYGQTYGGKGGAFIHEIPGTITNLKADGNDLTVEYSVTIGGTTTKYLTTYQDDTPIKNYNTEWMAEYPIILGNHLLEKEESDLYASYILPNSACKLEFWGSANHYHFWTFKVPYTDTPPTTGSTWDIQGLANSTAFVTTRLEFIEKNGDYYTFRLVGELPVMSGNETGKLIYLAKNQSKEMTYTEVNHFRKIGEITTSKYTEGEFRFTNLNNKLELPKSHSLQIMVKGKGTANHTPELFALDLVANQRERG